MCQCDGQNSQRPGIFLRSGCLASECGWEVDGLYEGQTNLAETVLCVLLGSGAQRQFSNVRITLCCESTIAENVREEWQIKPTLSSPSVVNRVSSYPSEQNSSCLPSYHAVFEIHQYTATSRLSDNTPRRTKFYVPPTVVNHLVFRDGEPEESQATSFHKFFAFDHPLTEDTQSVSVSFTSSRALTTSIFRDVFRAFPAGPAAIGRVVRVIPDAPAHDRRTIFLPNDILRSVFECFLNPEYRGWRKDILSSALVCRAWACALDLLFFDFRSWNQRKSPPELFSFVNALALRLDLGLSIKYLSTDYFTADMKKGFHLAGVPWPLGPGVQLQESLLSAMKSHASHWRSAVQSLFRAVKNVQTLSLSQSLSTTDLCDAISGLTHLEVLHAGSQVPIDQILHCLIACPSLKRLLIANGSRAFNFVGSTGAPESPPRCALTEIMISACQIPDGQLRYLVSSSIEQSLPTLEHLALVGVTGPSHKTLHSVLQSVSKSLVVLQIWGVILRVEEGGEEFEAEEFIPEEFGTREHALDAVIVHLERLRTLKISPNVATILMLQRRAQAFERSIKDDSHALPVIDLTLVHADSPQFKGNSLVEVAEGAWSGWAITSTKIPSGVGATAFIDPAEFFEPRGRS